ncbi:protein giant-like [Dermacentor albipictus]|uniref:protein giant-like n=1 Tax=Dermacentor albipictus TaxID=60249 RepID=UPI0031FDD726
MVRTVMDRRHHQQKRRHPKPVRPSSPLIDLDHLSPNASRCPGRNFRGRSARGSAGGDRKPPVQPLDFSLKGAAASSRPSPLAPEDHRRPSPDCVCLGAACSNPGPSKPLPSPELHHHNPSLLMPRTTTTTPASTSPPAPFQNGYANGHGGASDLKQGLHNSTLTSPPRSELSVSPALVRPPPQQPVTTPLQFHPPVNASTSPQPTVSSTTSKCKRLGTDLYSVADQFLPAAPAATTGLHHANQAAKAGSAAACLRAEFVNGRKGGHHRASRTTGSPSAAAGSASQLATTSPPPLSNGAATCRADSGEEGGPTSPENSNSSGLTVANEDTSTSGRVVNGETTTNGGALTANGGVAAANGGPPNGDRSAASGGGPIPSRRRGCRLPEEEKDDAYWERRRRNNKSAKKSRDARKAREKATAMKAADLGQENLRLRYEIAGLRAKLNLLQQVVYPNLFSQQLQQQARLQSFPPAHF